jgi:hypothetical protein
MAFSCVEEIDLINETDTNDESLLVVEATITNELRAQKILLSRTSNLDEEFEPLPESNATIIIKSSDNINYTFKENVLGEYLSTIPFKAKKGVQYQLNITTANGSIYGSSKMELTQETPIDNVSIVSETNIDGIEEVVISVDAYDPTGYSRYYRYEYEETYKILAPLYFPLELIPHDVQFPIAANTINVFNTPRVVDMLVDIQFREEEERVCYNTVKSNTIILANTVDLIEDKLEGFKIRFINKDNYIIAHRYSLLVRQYVQSREAYVYYETLKKFSDSENTLSENQTGFIEGNVFSESDSNENVIGFFEVSAVDEHRVFFNFEDLFHEESLNPYSTRCDQFWKPALLFETPDHELTRSPLLDMVNQGFQLFDLDFILGEDEFFFPPFDEGPFTLVLEQCGDCTVLGSNKVPDFWQD